MLVLGLNHPPFIAGLVTCAAIVPSMIAYLPAGGLVDRWDPWRVMLVSEVLRGIAVATIVVALLVPREHVSIYLLISVMVAEEILEIFWMLADRRLMSRLMERDGQGRVARGQASIEVRSHATMLAGRPLGPFLYSLSQCLPFLFDALSFVFSVVVLILLGRDRKRDGKPVVPAQKRQLWQEIGDGFEWLRGDLRAGTIMGLMSFTTLIAQALIMMFLVEAHDDKLSTAVIGMVLAASGAGGAIGAVVAKKLRGTIKTHFLRIQLCAWSGSLALLALPWGHFPWCIAIAMLVLGFTGSISNIEFGAYLVLKAGDKLARVTSIGQVMVIGACGIGPLIGGAAIQRLGVHGAVALFLVLVLLATGLAFWTPPISDTAAECGPAVSPSAGAGLHVAGPLVERPSGSGSSDREVLVDSENTLVPAK
jgi:MFS family permease